MFSYGEIRLGDKSLVLSWILQDDDWLAEYPSQLWKHEEWLFMKSDFLHSDKEMAIGAFEQESQSTDCRWCAVVLIGF